MFLFCWVKKWRKTSHWAKVVDQLTDIKIPGVKPAVWLWTRLQSLQTASKPISTFVKYILSTNEYWFYYEICFHVLIIMFVLQCFFSATLFHWSIDRVFQRRLSPSIFSPKCPWTTMWVLRPSDEETLLFLDLSCDSLCTVFQSIVFAKVHYNYRLFYKPERCIMLRSDWCKYFSAGVGL